MQKKTHAEDIQREVVELVACGRVRDALDAIDAYTADASCTKHLKNQLAKLERLGVVCAQNWIELDGDRFIARDLAAA